MEEKKSKKEEFRVVKELPMQPVRTIEDDDTIIHLLTIEEYLTQLINARPK